MKKTALVIVFLTFVLNAFAQSFEGVVVYKNRFKSKMSGMTDEQFQSMMGGTFRYSMKGANYRNETDGSFLLLQLYVAKDNKLYSKLANAAPFYWNDGLVNPDEVLKAEVNKNAETVLGHMCDELVLTCKSGIQKYYFSSDFPVDASLYANHKFGNWSEVIGRTNALPLKMVIENAQFASESVASEVKPMSLDDNLFTLPEGSVTEKSPF